MVTKKDNSRNVISIKKGALNSIKLLIKRTTHSDHKPRNKDLYLRDERLIGYYIRIRPNGRKTYNCEAKLNGIGKKVSITIGDCDLFTEKQARDIATEHLRKIKQGIDPKDHIRQSLKSEHSLETLCKEYVEIRILAENTKKDYLYRVPQQLGKLAKKDIKALTIADFSAWWSRATAQGSKKIALRYVISLLNFAKTLGYVDQNVAQQFKRGVLGGIKAAEPKQTHISIIDLPDWVSSFVMQSVTSPLYNPDETSIKGITPELPIRATVRDYILFLLITGKRKTEASCLTWKNVNFKNYTITLEKTKSGKVDVIPMTNLIWHMMKHRSHAKNKHSKFVFPNKYGNGGIVDVRRALKKIDIGCGREHTTAHDLRRTFATMTRELGMSNEATAILLNHSKRDVTEGYIITSLKNKRDNLDRVEKGILGFVSGWIKVSWYDGHKDWDVGDQPWKEEEEYYI